MLKEGRVDAVKIEGGRRAVPMVRAAVDAGVAVVGHIGLTPQSHAALGGYKLQGRTAAAAAELLLDAHALQEAGCFAVVLEMVPASWTPSTWSSMSASPFCKACTSSATCEAAEGLRAPPARTAWAATAGAP